MTADPFTKDNPDVEAAVAGVAHLRSIEPADYTGAEESAAEDIAQLLKVVDLLHGEYRWMRHCFDQATRGHR